jgi:hypothetical protein
LKINTEIIRKLNPCKDRFDNYLKHHESFNGNLKDFILLENITYKDKVWVFVRLATHLQNVKWSLLCASKVLSIFEKEYPNDDRPRKALEACEKYLNEPSASNAYYLADAANAAHVAAYAAYIDAVNTAHAAAYAAYVYAANAAHAAAYAAHAAYADAAAYAAKIIEEEVNLLFMIDAIN